MRQLVQSLRSGKVEVIEIPDPAPEPGEVLVRNRWSLISAGTESAVSDTASKGLIGKARARPDQARRVLEKAREDGLRSTVASVRARLDDFLTPGYSSMGVVEAVGRRVEGLRPGDRVGCFGANVACHADRVTVPQPLCMKLPDDLDDRWGAFGAVGGIAAHPLRLGGVSAGSVVAVIGVGLVGQVIVQLARASGARAIAIDTAANRVELALEQGASAGAVLGVDDVGEVVSKLSEGRGADAVMIAAATRESGPIELAGSIARDRGAVIVVGDVGMDIPRAPFFEKELQLRVSRSYGPGRYDPAYETEGHDYPVGYVRWTERRLIRWFFDELAAGKVRLDGLITHEHSIDEATDAYEALADPGRLAIMIRYDNPGGGGADTARRPVAGPKRRAGSGRMRVAVVGPGLFARSTLLPLLSRLDVEIAGIAGNSGDKALSAARRWGGGDIATDPMQFVDDPSINAMVVATRHDSHASLVAAALQADMAVFVEKPLAITSEEVDQLKPLIEGGGRLVVDFNRAFSPAAISAAAHLAGREEPLALGYRVNAGLLEPGHWLRDPDIGGGRLVGEGCHFIDLCSHLVGSPTSSFHVTGMGEAPGTLPGDNWVLTIRYTDGSVAAITYASNGASRMGKERLEVLGAGRSVVIDDFRRVELFPSKARRGRRMRRDKGHAALLEAAFAYFRDGGNPPVPFERIVETTEVSLAARDALARGDEGPVAVTPG